MYITVYYIVLCKTLWYIHNSAVYLTCILLNMYITVYYMLYCINSMVYSDHIVLYKLYGLFRSGFTSPEKFLSWSMMVSQVFDLAHTTVYQLTTAR